jgi:oligopeptide transport system ATP-binding protein
MARLPPGCPFSERCPVVMERCVQQRPPLVPSPTDAAVLRACHRDPSECLPEMMEARA